jgi:predicted nucleotidyltransferase
MSVEKLVHALVAADVRFIIIGGVSAIIHGSVHTTNAIDVFYPRYREYVAHLTRALAPFHPPPVDLPAGRPFLWEESTLRNATLLTLDTDLGRIDLLVEVSGLGPFEQVWEESPEVELYGRRVRTLNLRSLITAKRAAGRDKDLRVIPELESLLEAQEE